MHAQNEKFSKKLKTIKKNQSINSGAKNTIIALKNSIENFNRRLQQAGRRKNKRTKDRLYEILYLEMQRLKGMKKCIKPTGLTGPSQEHNITQWELWEENKKKKSL